MRKSLRIKGLVSYSNGVRMALQAGIPEDRLAAFRNGVDGTVRQLNELCKRYGIRPDQLPGPSRNAYQFLKELNLTDLPVASAGETVPAPRAVRIKNELAIARQFGRRMWDQLPVLMQPGPELICLRDDLRRQAGEIDQICERTKSSPSSLAASSRQLYCWLKYLSNDESLALHLAGLAQARDAGLAAQKFSRSPLEVHLFNIESLWRANRSRERILLRVNMGFVAADAATWNAIVHAAVGRGSRAGGLLVREFADSEEFREVLAEIESFAEQPSESTRGRTHDLQDSFERVNRDYFAGLMEKPRLTWSRVLTMSVLGHYRFSADTVMLSLSLDDPRVSPSLLDFVMYHELLHKRHGAVTSSGRRMVHTAQFRADERRYDGYEQAKRQMEEVARRHRRRGRG